jgi:hypothetical protein
MNTNVDISIQTITPTIARGMLEANKGNRPRADKHVKKLALAMKNGEWKFNGEAIKFNGDKLVDGQHRLSAIVESGVSVQTLVIRNLDDDVFDTIDQGKKRTMGDTLSVLGEKHYNQLASVLRMTDAYYTGTINTNKPHNPSNADADRLLGAYPEARRSVDYVSKSGIRKHVQASVAGTFHCIASRVDGVAPEDVDTFVQRVATGVGLQETDAEYKLRDKLIENRTSAAKLPQRVLLAYWIKAWNLHRKGKPVKILRLKLSGDGAEDFPTAM